MTSPRVAFVITGFGVGGAERQVIDLSEALSSRGVQVLVVTLIDPTSWGVASLGDTAALESLEMARGRPDPRAVLRLRRIVKSWRPDIVHAHMFHANILSRVALDRDRWPLVNTIHNVQEVGRSLEIVQARTRHIPGWTTLVSNAAMQRQSQARLIDDGRSSVIYNGFSFDRLDEIADNEAASRDGNSDGSPFVWLAIGRLEPQKDYPNLLNAVAGLRETGHDVNLNIAGSGYLEADLRRHIERLGLDSTVSLLGHIDDVVGLLRRSDAVVNSSVLEGLPISLIEASALAVPIVATDVGGTREVVGQGRSGFLVEKEDWGGLAAGMAGLMELPLGKRRAMGRAGAAHARASFDLTHVVDEWLQLYQRLAPDISFEKRRTDISGSGTAK